MQKGKNSIWQNFPWENVARGIWENSYEGIAIVDRNDKKILAANHTLAEITGYSESELINKKISDLFPINFIEDLKTNTNGYSNNAVNVVETQIIDKNSKKNPVKIKYLIIHPYENNKPLSANNNKFILLIVNPHENTTKSLALTNLLLSSLTEINSRFISGTPAKSVFNDLLSTLIKLTDSEFGFIGEIKYTPKGKPFLKVHSFTNIAWSEETRKLYNQYENVGLEFYNLNNLFGAAVSGREAVISNDPENDPRSKGVPPGHPKLRSFLCVPFKKGGQIIGLAGVANRPGGYNQEIVDFLEPFLTCCASIVEALRIDEDRRKMEESLKNSLQVKESLLRELHHRVKNNLQVVISLLNLEASHEKSTHRVIQNLRNRIKAISIVHEILYQTDNINEIDLKEYLFRLCENLKIVFRNQISKIKFSYHFESIHLDINKAINIGIIVNELVSNAIIHAFPENSDGAIYVEAFKTSKRSVSANHGSNSNHGHSKNSNNEKLLVITVSDTGIGFPETFDLKTCDSLGFQLCKQLSSSMNGTISISRSKQYNTIVSVIIPIKIDKK